MGGRTPLMEAAMRARFASPKVGHLNVVRALLTDLTPHENNLESIDVNAQDSEKKTALDWVRNFRSTGAIRDLLLEHEAKTGAQLLAAYRRRRLALGELPVSTLLLTSKRQPVDTDLTTDLESGPALS